MIIIIGQSRSRACIIIHVSPLTPLFPVRLRPIDRLCEPRIFISNSCKRASRNSTVQVRQRVAIKTRFNCAMLRGRLTPRKKFNQASNEHIYSTKVSTTRDALSLIDVKMKTRELLRSAKVLTENLRSSRKKRGSRLALGELERAIHS